MYHGGHFEVRIRNIILSVVNFADDNYKPDFGADLNGTGNEGLKYNSTMN